MLNRLIDPLWTARSPDSSSEADGQFTVRQGRRYRATVTLGWFEQFASNDMIAGKLRDVGFADVTVTGDGDIRVAEALWPGPDTSAALDPHLLNVSEIV